MPTTVDARTLKTWLSDGQEIALLDVREHGEYGEGHLFFAVPLPYSRFELDVPRLVPRPGARVVLYDGEGTPEGPAHRAAGRARGLGYSAVTTLAGGAGAWAKHGFGLFKGVNVPSKTFGELVELQRHTPRISASELAHRQAAGDDLVVLDGRPLAEYRKMSIPGGVCCPNGELALRARTLVPRPETTIVVNCAGRTRSIIGAQTLIDVGIPNKVLALENGTQGWFLGGLKLAHGADRAYPASAPPRPDDLAAARALAARSGAEVISPATVAAWLADAARTTYVFDVRTPEEFAAGSLKGAVHAPGGQLIQATDQWVGVKGARIVLADADGVRAPVVAAWLRQLGHAASILDGGIGSGVDATQRAAPKVTLPELPPTGAEDLAAMLWSGSAIAIDLRPSMAYRRGHVPGARWSIRPLLRRLAVPSGRTVVLIADEKTVAALARLEFPPDADVRALSGGIAAWTAAGQSLNASPDVPADADCIDYLFFTHDRHDGNAAAARQYLAWETGLLAALDDQERGAFRVLPDRG